MKPISKTANAVVVYSTRRCGSGRRAHFNGWLRAVVWPSAAAPPRGIHHDGVCRCADRLHALRLLQRCEAISPFSLSVQAGSHHRKTGKPTRQCQVNPMRYCESPFFYQRRPTREIVVGDPSRGGVIIGGRHPVVRQSMLTCDTMDTAECVRQTLELVAVG